jgi:stage II sporulation protein D
MVAGTAEELMLPGPTLRPHRQHPPAARRLQGLPPRARRRGHRWSGLVLAAIASIALSAFGPALGTATAAPLQARPLVAVPSPPSLPDLTLYGRGYGHGVGMSQYGARGRALAGQPAPAILAHYYPKTTLGTRSTTTTIRVLLLTGLAATAAKPLRVIGLGGGWTIDGFATTFPANARLTLSPTAALATTWNLKVVSSTGSVLAKKVVSGNVYVRPAGTSSLLQLVSKAGTKNVYRGFFRIRLTTKALVVNHVSIEHYLRGVVPTEMPSTWPVEALRAQAIAARSYALYRVHPSGSFDVYDDTRSQVYRGRRAETTATNAAVRNTAGKVLLSGTSVANAMFHSADGGWTENNENVFVGSTGSIVAGAVPYLRGSSDRAPDGSSYDKASPYATWKTATYSAATLSAILARDARTKVGIVTALDLSDRGVSGRLISVTIIGDLGIKTVSGDVFRAAFNAGKPAADPAMRGTLFDIAPIP